MNDSLTKPRVAFQGERGAFSEEAAVKLLGAQIELVPRPTFEAMFAAIGEGAADLILAPLENSLAGSVYRCYDLLLESKPAHHGGSDSAHLASPDRAARSNTGAGAHRAVAPGGAGAVHAFSSSTRKSRAWWRKIPEEARAKWCTRAILRARPSPAGARRRSTAARFCSRISKTITAISRASCCYPNRLGAQGRQQDFAGGVSAAPAGRAVSCLGAAGATRHQSGENRKPPHYGSSRSSTVSIWT